MTKRSANKLSPENELQRELFNLRAEIYNTMSEVATRIALGKSLDPEHVAVIRGSSERFAELVEKTGLVD